MNIDIAVEQYHRWRDMVFEGKDGIPPLMPVYMHASTMAFFLKETKLLKLLFAPTPEHPEHTNTNIATVLYDKDKLLGIAIEYGDDDFAYRKMERIEISDLVLPCRKDSKKHAEEIIRIIKEKKGINIGLVKCADLDGFFGNLRNVLNSGSMLEALVQGFRVACESVANKDLTIEPRPKFFDYLAKIEPLVGCCFKLARFLNTEKAEDYIRRALPNLDVALVIKGREDFVAVTIGAYMGNVYFNDMWPKYIHKPEIDDKLKILTKEAKHVSRANIAVGITTDCLYKTLQNCLSKNPYKLVKELVESITAKELIIL